MVNGRDGLPSIRTQDSQSRWSASTSPSSGHDLESLISQLFRNGIKIATEYQYFWKCTLICKGHVRFDFEGISRLLIDDVDLSSPRCFRQFFELLWGKSSISGFDFDDDKRSRSIAPKHYVGHHMTWRALGIDSY